MNRLSSTEIPIIPACRIDSVDVIVTEGSILVIDKNLLSLLVSIVDCWIACARPCILNSNISSRLGQNVWVMQWAASDIRLAPGLAENIL